VHPCRASVKGAAKAGGLILAAIVSIQRFDGDPDLAANLTRGEGAGPRTDPFGSARLRRRFRQTELRSEPRRQSDELFALDDRRDAPSPTLQAWAELAWL
jgi:hypothetical protein